MWISVESTLHAAFNSCMHGEQLPYRCANADDGARLHACMGVVAERFWDH